MLLDDSKCRRKCSSSKVAHDSLKALLALKEVSMGNKIYVGNLPFSATKDSLGDLFSPFGTVDSVKIVTDRDTGLSKGFGFVEMSNDDEAQTAIDKLNGSDMGGRSIVVNEARPMEPKSNNVGGGNRSGNRGGFGGGNRNGGNRW